jgi:hypothetical protein
MCVKYRFTEEVEKRAEQEYRSCPEARVSIVKTKPDFREIDI